VSRKIGIMLYWLAVVLLTGAFMFCALVFLLWLEGLVVK
jgi:hypothetical protein